ncbi:hypothetical protein D3C80_1154240 [compost metagenome]
MMWNGFLSMSRISLPILLHKALLILESLFVLQLLDTVICWIWFTLRVHFIFGFVPEDMFLKEQVIKKFIRMDPGLMLRKRVVVT